jgi:hypothetical protein
MDLVDYGALVFDLASDVGSLLETDLTGFGINLNSMSLVTGDLLNITTTPVYKYNIIK